MGIGVYPDNLRVTFWDRKKGTLPAGCEVIDKLKTLQRKHDAVDFKPFEPGWVKQSGATLDDAYATRQRLYQAKVLGLRADANLVVQAAQRLGKDKASGKPTQDAAKLIVAAATALSKDIDQGLDELRQAYEKARAGQPAASADAKDSGDAALLDPKRVLQVLQLCKRDPLQRVQFAYVDGKDKQPALLAMHPKNSGRSMFAKLLTHTDVKAGAFGTAWIDDKTLLLQPEKALGGLAKRIRAPLMTCGFRIPKIVLVGADGVAGESDADPNAVDPDDEPVGPSGRDEANFTLRLKALLGRLQALGAAPAAQLVRQILGRAGEQAKKKEWAPAHGLLDSAEEQVDLAELGTGAASPTLVAFTRTRLTWDQTRKNVQAELMKLEKSILDACRGEVDIASIASGAKSLYTMLDHLDERLIDTLDAALNAKTAPQRKELNVQALKIVGEYQAYVAGQELLRDIDDNGFVPVAIASTLNDRLAEMSRQLSALTA